MVGLSGDRELTVWAVYPDLSFDNPNNVLFFDDVQPVGAGVNILPTDWTVFTPPPNVQDVLPTVAIYGDIVKITYPAAQEGAHFIASIFNGLVFTWARTPGLPTFSSAMLIDTDIPGLTPDRVVSSDAGRNSFSVNVENLVLPTAETATITLQLNFGPPYYQPDPNDGQPEHWPVAAAPAATRISVGILPLNVNPDIVPKGFAAAFYSLVEHAEAIWQQQANIQFVNVADPLGAQLQIGFAKLDPPGNAFAAGYTDPTTNGEGTLLKAQVEIEDPDQVPIVPNPTELGDFSWVGQPTSSMFATIMHEIGHALGLAHNPDPNSIMAPGYIRNPATTLPDDVDIADLGAVYGARTTPSPLINPFPLPAGS